MKKIVFIMMALVCAKMLNAKVIVAAAADEPAAAYDTLMVAEDTLLYPQHPQPIHLDLRTPRRATMAASCPTDSIVGLDAYENYVSKVEYEYDDAGNTVGETKYEWQNGVKRGISKYWKKYSGSLTPIVVNYKWDAETGWMRKDSTYKDYNANGQEMLNEKYLWEYNGEEYAWRIDEQTKYERDAAGRATLTQLNRWKNGLGLTPVNKYVKEYNAAGQWVLDTYWVYNNGEWQGSIGAVNEYDANGNLVTEESYNGWSDNKWVGSSRTTHSFTDANYPKKETEKVTYTWKSGDWEPSSKTETKYNIKGYKIETASYNYKSGAWVGKNCTTYDVRDDGKTTCEIRWKWTAGAWVYNKKTEYAYSGSLVSMQASYDWNDKWVGSSKFEKTFSGSNVTLYVEYTWGTDDWTYSTKEETTYVGSSSTVESKLKYKWVSGAWMGLSYTKSVFDGKKLSAYLTYAWDGSDWRDSIRTSYTYDAKGDTLLKVNAEWKESAWQAIDSTKHEIKYAVIAGTERDTLNVYSKWTKTSNVWVETSKQISKFDAAGNKILSESFSNGIKTTHYEWAYKNNNGSYKTLEINMTYNSSSELWYGHYKREFDYDDAYHKILTAEYKWDYSLNEGQGGWIGSSKTEDVYTGSNKTCSTTSKWSASGWVLSSRNTFVYNAAGKVVDQVSQTYNTATSSWVNQTRYVKEYIGSTEIASYTYTWNASEDEWCFVKRVEKRYDEDAQGKLRYQLDATYTNCKISKYDLKRYYYRCDPKTYTISFYAWNDTLLLQVPATEGTTAAYPDSEELPVKTGDKEYTYTFAGWTPALAIVTGDASYKATYTSTKKTYTVTFQNDDNTPLQSTQVEYGLKPEYTGETPAKAKTDQYTYTFSGWSPTVVAVEDNATYTAQFTPTVNQYTIKFVIGDQTYPMTLDYGTSLTAIVNQVRQDYGDSYQTTEYVYTFDGWVEGEPETVTGDATYTMKYKQADRTYAITFNNYDDQLLQTVHVAYGQTPSYSGEPPVKAGDAEWSYQFDGWTPELVAVDGEATYTAVFKEQKNKYTITFVIGENSYPLSLEYGTSLSAIVNQVRQDYGDSYQTKVYVYTFDGWVEGEPETVTGDATYTMKYKQEDRKYDITFNNYDDQLLLTVQVAYGQTPSYTGETPVKAEDAEYTYTFGGWTPEVAAVEGDAVYTATFTATPKVPTGIENTDAAGQATKIYREGQIYILRNGKMYDVNGKEVE